MSRRGGVRAFVAALLLSLAGTSLAQVSVTPEKEEACGAWTGTGWDYHYVDCHARPDTGLPFWAWTGIRPQEGSSSAYQWNRRVHSPDICYPGGNSTQNNLSYSVALSNSLGAASVWSSCPLYFPPPGDDDPTPDTPADPDGWVCARDVPPGHGYCERYEDDVMDVSWFTPCANYVGFDLTPAERDAAGVAYIAAEQAGCEDADAPTPPEHIECIGADGLACESTLRDVRYLLQQMLHRESLVPVSPPVSQEAPPPFTVPGIDRSLPDWEGWVAPEFEEIEEQAMVSRIGEALANLRATAEGKFPFGLVAFVPEPENVVAGAACDDIVISLMPGVAAAELGWCGSAIESFLAGFGRSSFSVLMLIGFGFAVARMGEVI